MVMIDLLRLLHGGRRPEAGEEAQRCVLAALADPTLLLDHLLSLKPAPVARGHARHQLLNIFIIARTTPPTAPSTAYKALVDSWV